MEPDRALTEFWPAFDVDKNTPVLVPLSGKSVDMDWLVQRGHRVIGVEFIEKACRSYFEERGLQFEIIPKSCGLLYKSECIEIWCADIFKIPDEIIHACKAVYDRAALVALPDELRVAYVEKVYGNLESDTKALLVSFEYDDHIMNGPPFSIPPVDIQKLFNQIGEIHVLHSADIIDNLEKFKRKGLTKLQKNTYKITINAQ